MKPRHILGAVALTIASSAVSASPLPPIRFIESTLTDEFMLINEGTCPLYKVKISTIPPDRGTLSSIAARLSAHFLGYNSYTMNIGRLSAEDSFNTYTISRRDFINNSGERLTKEIEVDTFSIKGSYCGEDFSAIVHMQ